MTLKWPKIAQKAKKGIRKVQNGHETVKKGPNFAFRSRRKMPKNEPPCTDWIKMVRKKTGTTEKILINVQNWEKCLEFVQTKT